MTKNQRKIFKPILSLILAVTMLVGMAPAAFAAETPPSSAMKDEVGSYKLYMANGESFVNVGDKEVSSFMVVDERLFTEFEDITMELEIRQYNNSGYKVVGSEKYNYTELQTFKNKGVYDSEAKTYTFKDLKLKVDADKDFTEDWQEYCVVKFSRPSWKTAEDKQEYKWTYTGDAKVLGAGVEKPLPIVWLYNLEESSYRGAMIRSILDELSIPAGTVNNSNLNQNIGYLVGWNGYAPSDNPYSGESYDVEYILMGNLTEVQLDDFIAGMQENNIRVNLKSIPTAWTAGKTFAELFDIMAEEDEVLKAAVALDKMIYEAESLDEATYSSSPYWPEFKTTLDEAIVALSTDAEETGEGAALYENARLKLLDVYLKVTGKTLLAGELELTAEKQEDGTYKISAKLNGEHKDATFTYNWKQDGSTESTATVKAGNLHKVSLQITGTEKYYGTLDAKLYVPEAPEFTAEAGEKSIKVDLKEQAPKLNTPATEGYVVELYLDGEKVHSQDVKKAGTVVFNGLEEDKEYTVKVNSYNAVGRSDIVEENVTVAKVEDDTVVGDDTVVEDDTVVGDDAITDSEDDATTEDDTVVEDDVVTEDDAVVEEDNTEDSDVKFEEETTTENEKESSETADKETTEETPETGDETNLALLMMIAAAGLATAGATVRRKER